MPEFIPTFWREMRETVGDSRIDSASSEDVLNLQEGDKFSHIHTNENLITSYTFDLIIS